MATRKQNERKFSNWIELSEGGRRYWLDISGQNGWFARYIKEVDNHEKTTKFLQEIYNKQGKLVEIHEKYPIDKGHKKIN